MVQRILNILDEHGITYRHYTEDELIEADLGGQERLYEFTKILHDNIEQWVYEDLIDCKITIDFPFERISITY